MLKLKLQYFGHLMWRTDSPEKTFMLGKFEGRRTRGRQRMRWLDGITNSMDMSLNNFWKLCWIGKPGMLKSMESWRVGHDWVTELNWPNNSKCIFTVCRAHLNKWIFHFCSLTHSTPKPLNIMGEIFLLFSLTYIYMCVYIHTHTYIWGILKIKIKQIFKKYFLSSY